MRTTNPPEFEPEPEDSPTLAEALLIVTHVPLLEVSPESTLRHDVYINKKFADIFAHEDRSGALAHAFEKSLSANDNGGTPQSGASGLAAWWRAAREAEQK